MEIFSFRRSRRQMVGLKIEEEASHFVVFFYLEDKRWILMRIRALMSLYSKTMILTC
jgi:hypothetical protein